MTTDFNLFDRKELYKMEHSPSGKSYKTTQIPKQQRRKVIYQMKKYGPYQEVLS